MRDTSFFVAPIRDHAFFEQSQFKSLFGDNLLQVPGLTAQVLDLVRRGRPGCIAGKPFLASLQELLRPFVVKALGDTLAPAKLRD